MRINKEKDIPTGLMVLHYGFPNRINLQAEASFLILTVHMLKALREDNAA